MTTSSKPAFLPLLLGLLLLATPRLQGEQDYAARLKELNEQKAEAQIEPLLNEWREKRPNDPDAWVSSANYYFNERRINISTKKPTKGDFPLNNLETGEPAGSISLESDMGAIKRATTLLQEATKKFPGRVDIWCGLAFLQQETGDFDAEFATLKNMIAYTHDHPARLQWLKGEKLPDPPDQFLAEKIHSYGMYYEKKETPENDRRFFRIAMFATESFPNIPYGFNDVGMFYSVSGEPAKAREWLEKANRIAPNDTLILMNLGQIALKLHDDRSARKWFEEVIKREPKGEFAEQARNALGKLKKK
jgi:tetratricopeptide (TPR) repeat protein